MSDLSGHAIDLPPEQQAIQAKCFHPSGTFVPFRKEEIEQSIPDRFERQAQQFPDRIAIKTKTHQFTYEQLNQAANRVARTILAQRGIGEEPIALLIEQGAPQIIAMLGVLKAGKIVAALDPSYPRERTHYMLMNSQAGLILSNDKNFSVASELANKGSQPLNIEDLDDSFATEDLGLSISPDNLSHILYTSGSTGQPKGVYTNHRNLLHQMRNYTNLFHICAEDRLTLLTSVTGQAMNIIFCTLFNGAALYSLNIKEDGVAPLANWLTQHEITIYMSGSPLFRHFTQTLTGQEEFPRLRLVRLASQTVLKSDVDLYKAHFPADCIFATGLSSSETGRVLNYYIDKDTQITTSSVPVGFPLDGNKVLLLDEDGQEVGFNQVGEITVKSRYLAQGYWGKPGFTREAFQPDPSGEDQRIYRMGDLGRRLPDGSLEILGRKDFQIKVRGYRVEVAEIETRLMELDNVKEAVVVGQEDASGNQRLVAYIVTSGKWVSAVTDLRSVLTEKLPDYMVPSAFVTLDVLPQTLNGKVNRPALPTIDWARPELNTAFVAPGNPVEAVLARIWADVLGIEQVGIHDNFLELGGDSLFATLVAFRVSEAFHIELPLPTLFNSPTVACLAECVDTLLWASQGLQIDASTATEEREDLVL